MKKILLFIVAILLFGCDNKEDKVAVFLYSDYEEGTPVKLWIDDTIRYDEKYKEKYHPSSGLMPAIYINKSDTTRVFRIKMMDKDTTFIHNMSGVDKISISVLEKKGFVIFDSNYKEAWYLQ